MPRTIVVVPYENRWETEFNKIRQELAQALGDSALTIEHVGSTSVKGLFAKPIIDIDIVIESEWFEIVKQKLAAIGYSHVGDLGIRGREAFQYQEKPHLMEHHLYVCAREAEEYKRHITFRNHLRAHEADRDRYSQIKLEMARKFPHDIDGYLNGKQPFILEIYQKCGL